MRFAAILLALLSLFAAYEAAALTHEEALALCVDQNAKSEDVTIGACEQVLRESSRSSQDAGQAHEGLCRRLLAVKKNDLAIPHCNAWVESSPVNDDALRTRCIVLMSTGRLSGALADCSNAALLEPGKARNHETHCVVLTKLRNYPEAFSACSRAVKLDPTNTAWLTSRAMVGVELEKDVDQSLADVNEALRLKGDDVEALWMRGMIFTFSMKWELAENDYTSAIQRKPDFGKAYSGLGMMHMFRGDDAKALANLSAAISLGDQRSLNFNNRGALYLKQGKSDLALQDFNKAIQLNPYEAVAWNNRCFLTGEAGDFSAALPDCDRAISLEPRNPSHLHSRGSVLGRLKEYDRAIADFNASLAAKFDPNVLVSRARAWQFKGDLDKSLADLNEALRLDPKLERGYERRAEVLLLLGRAAEAKADVERHEALKSPETKKPYATAH